MHTLHNAWTVIEASAPMRVLRAHRHVLLAPAFFVMVSLMLGQATLASPETSLLAREATTSSRGVVLPGGSVLLPSLDATYSVDDVVELHQGSMLANAHGMLTVGFSSSGSVTGWNGGFFALRERRSLTVATITTPVVVRLGSGTLLVPMGMQWTLPLGVIPTDTGADLTAFLHTNSAGPLPRSFLEEQRRALAAPLTPAAPVARNLRTSISDVLAGHTTSLFDRQEEQRLERITGLEAAVSMPDMQEATRLVSASSDLLQGDEGQALLARLLATPSLSLELRSALLGNVTDATLQLLLTVHPLLRTEGLLAFEGGREDLRALLLDLPLTDTQPSPLPELIIRRWSEELMTHLEHAADRDAEFLAVLRGIEQGIREQRMKQFVHRMAFYASAAKQLGARFDASLTDEQRALLVEIDKMTESPVPALPVPEAAQAVSSAPPLTLAEVEELQEHVRAMLLEKGGLFTKKTELRADSGQKVRVAGIAFATPRGDELFSFTINPETAMLSDILRDGKESSFAVSMEQFLEWISR